MEELLDDGFPFAEDVLGGQTALVCGASKGIGRACALMLARAGARVVACARSQTDLDSLVAEMHGDGHEAVVLDLEDIEAVRQAMSSMGGVQIVVNNSGGPPGGALLENTLEDLEGPWPLYTSDAADEGQGLGLGGLYRRKQRTRKDTRRDVT